MKKLSLLFLAFFCLVATTTAQRRKITITNGCNYANGHVGEQTLTVDEPTKLVKEVVSEIMDEMGILKVEQDKFNIVTPLEGKKVPNAQASMIGNQPYIIVNTDFILKAREKASKWAVYIIMAHELAHIVQFHDLKAVGLKARQQELNADTYAGGVLAKLGVNLEQMEQILDKLELPVDTSTHPPVDERKLFMKIGYDDAKNMSKKNQRIQFDLDKQVFKSPNLVLDPSYIKMVKDYDKVEITISLPATLKGKRLNICLKSNGETLEETIGTGSEISYSPTKKIIWNYRESNIPIKEADIKLFLQVYVFDMDRPTPIFSPKDKLALGSIGAIGFYGIVSMAQGNNLHTLYCDVRYEDAPEYANESREDRYKRANKKFVTGQVLLYAGGTAFLTGATFWLIRKNKGPRKDPKTICTHSPKVLWEPLAITESAQTRVGICLRF